MKRRRAGRTRRGRTGRRLLGALLALPLLLVAAMLVGALVPVNADWTEPDEGTTVYLRSNGVHVDIVMPTRAGGLDWRPLLPVSDFADPPPVTRWVGVGAGERKVYLETPTWKDLTFSTALHALTGGERVLHVDRTAEPGAELVAIRLRPEEYRRLWAGIRAEFDGPPRRIDHPGYGPDDAFYEGRGKANAIHTCNQWVADRLRVAGIRTSLWSPLPASLLWRYRAVSPSGAD